MNLQINKEWLLRMAEKEGNGIVSVGGLACRLDATVQPQHSPATEQSGSNSDSADVQTYPSG